MGSSRRASKADQLPVLRQELRWAPRIGDGLNAAVYRIGPHRAAKLIKRPLFGFRRCNRTVAGLVAELDVMRQLRRAGVAVPEPEGVFRIRLRGGPIGRLVRRKGIALVMEFLEGVSVSKIAAREPLQQMNREVTKAMLAGFEVDDVHPGNALWVPRERKTYLVDFEDWRSAAPG